MGPSESAYSWEPGSIELYRYESGQRPFRPRGMIRGSGRLRHRSSGDRERGKWWECGSLQKSAVW